MVVPGWMRCLFLYLWQCLENELWAERSKEEWSKIASPPLFSFFRNHHVLHEKLPTYFNLAFNTDVHRCSKLLIRNYLGFLKISIVVLKNI